MTEPIGRPNQTGTPTQDSPPEGIRFQRLFDVYPFNSPWVQHTFVAGVRRWWLPVWFALNSFALLLYLVTSYGSVGFDVRLYRLAADAWLSGQNPWTPTLGFDAAHTMISYAGPPPTLLPSIFLAWIPIDVLVLGFALISGLAALWTLRRLGLPFWWMLFPPIIQGIWVGNLNILVIALLVSGLSVAGGIATVFKTYAAIPLVILGRWQPLLIAAAILVVTFPFLPWGEFLTEYPRISASLATQAWGGETNMLTTPLVTIGAGIALVLLGRERAAWLAVPVLWPATQLHYTVMALPALSPVLAAFAAPNHPGYLSLGVMLYALWSRRHVLSHIRRPARAESYGGQPATDDR